MFERSHMLTKTREIEQQFAYNLFRGRLHWKRRRPELSIILYQDPFCLHELGTLRKR